MGGDPESPRRADAIRVSIRAPAWGATYVRRVGRSARQSFNPRPRMGGDLTPWQITKVEAFQSAPPHGGRLEYILRGEGDGKFQSAPPHGGRPPDAQTNQTGSKFQSAPPHGGRRDQEASQQHHQAVSIRAPAWGATPPATLGSSRNRFQSAPPHGGRRAKFRALETLIESFNPRPRMGGDGECGQRTGHYRGFNPRPRMGGDTTPMP